MNRNDIEELIVVLDRIANALEALSSKGMSDVPGRGVIEGGFMHVGDKLDRILQTMEKGELS